MNDFDQFLLTQAMGQPIRFYRKLGFLVKGANTILMLSQSISWSMASQDGWFCKTQYEWEDSTLLTRSEQETARNQLRSTTFWQEERRGLPARLFFRVDLVELARAWEGKSHE